MDTLFNDLLTLLEGFYEVLPTVFLTDKQIELEDAEESVYERRIWPWILYDLKRNNNYIIKELVKDNRLDILSRVNFTDHYKNLIIEKAFQYGCLSIIEYYNGLNSSKLRLAQMAIRGSRVDLFDQLDIFDLGDSGFLCDLYLAAYNSGCIKIINRLDELFPNDHRVELDIPVVGAMRGGHIQLLKILMSTNLERFEFGLHDFKFRHFETSKFMIEHGLKIYTHELHCVLYAIIRDSKSRELLAWFLSKYSSLIDESYYHSAVKECLLQGKTGFIRELYEVSNKETDLEIIDSIVGSWETIDGNFMPNPGCRKLFYIITKYKQRINLNYNRIRMFV